MTTADRSHCETYEVLISTWLDAGLERAEQRELLDHLVRCAGCRRFYADGRALEGLVAVAGAGAALESPPAGLWERIERRANRVADGSEGWPAWAWRAAAVLLLVVALAFVLWPGSRPADRTARHLDIVLEENRGDMTDGRFLELAAEILRADRRYHFAMQEVMERVVDGKWEAEGASSEGLTEDRTKERDGGEASRLRV